MPVKTFSQAEQLTAADTNTYLNNGGLVYITSQTIGSAVSSVTVSNCFSSTYDNYLVLINGGTSSAAGQTRMQLGATATGYYYAGAYCVYGGALSASTVANGSVWLISTTSGSGNLAEVYITSPNLATRTGYRTSYISPIAADGGVVLTGFLDNTTQYTSFTLSCAAGTMTGGTIRVYGYRQA